ncbi:MAG: hypothetical protein ABH828_06480 [archaeon]
MTIVNKTLNDFLKTIESSGRLLMKKVDEPLPQGHKEKGQKIIRKALFGKEIYQEKNTYEFMTKIDLAIENIVTHAYMGKNQPYKVEIYQGEKGFVVRLKNQSKGFDFREIQRKYENKKKYYDSEGTGWAAFNQKDILVSFEEEGTVINLMSFKEEFMETPKELNLYNTIILP